MAPVSAVERMRREEQKARYLKTVSSKPLETRIIVKAQFKNGYTAARSFQTRKEVYKHIEKRRKDERVKYIYIIPPQNYLADRMEREADKGGYNIEKYQKIFGK